MILQKKHNISEGYVSKLKKQESKEDIKPEKMLEVIIENCEKHLIFTVEEDKKVCHKNNSIEKITVTCDSIKNLLLEKNAKYGDSALNPKRIFSKSDNIEQIKVRIDDKLSRIENTGITSSDEDTLQDLIGYLILLKIALKGE